MKAEKKKLSKEKTKKKFKNNNNYICKIKIVFNVRLKVLWILC